MQRVLIHCVTDIQKSHIYRQWTEFAPTQVPCWTSDNLYWTGGYTTLIKPRIQSMVFRCFYRRLQCGTMYIVKHFSQVHINHTGLIVPKRIVLTVIYKSLMFCSHFRDHEVCYVCHDITFYNDWFIVCCLMSSNKYCIHIQDEYNFSKNLYTWKMDNWCNQFLLPLKSWENW